MFVQSRIRASTVFLLKKGIAPADAGLSLEAGMKGFSGELGDLKILRVADIPNFPETHLEGRRERILGGTLLGRAVLVHEGRGHLHEGYFHRELAYPVRVFAALGVGRMVFVATVVPLEEENGSRKVVVVEDHMDLTGGSPLRGETVAGKVREPDPSLCHSASLGRKAVELAEEYGLQPLRGVLALLPGPLEPTRAERGMVRAMGANFFGFSPAAELAVARSLGVETVVIGLLSRTGGKKGQVQEEAWGAEHLALVRSLLAVADGRRGLDLGPGGP